MAGVGSKTGSAGRCRECETAFRTALGEIYSSRLACFGQQRVPIPQRECQSTLTNELRGWTAERKEQRKGPKVNGDI